MSTPLNDEVDVWARTLVTDGCWWWIGGAHSDGYGRMRWRGGYALAHRLMYELAKGPIPEGMQVDHLCRNRGCVNPSHMEIVTPRENVLRGVGLSAANARKTHCKHGHPLDGENVVVVLMRGRPTRLCVVCRKATTKRHNDKTEARRRLERMAS